jgi:hypothetical protein
MPVLTLDEIKTHLRIELDDASRDAELLNLEAAAVDHAQQFIGRTIPWLDELAVPVAVPASVKAAIKLFIADLDQHRENTVVGVTYSSRQAAENLLQFYRVGMGI